MDISSKHSRRGRFNVSKVEMEATSRLDPSLIMLLMQLKYSSCSLFFPDLSVAQHDALLPDAFRVDELELRVTI
jgi:hypothetical protein